MPQNENLAQNESRIAELFGEALSLQQQKKWDEALAAYKQITDLGPSALTSEQTAGALHNMSLIALEKSDTALAYIWSKKATSLHPSNQQISETFQHIESLFRPPVIPKQLSNMDQLKTALQNIPQDAAYITTLVLSLAALFVLSRKLTQKLKDKANQTYQKINWWPFYLLLIFSLISFAFSYAAYQVHHQVRGLILSPKAAVQIVPGTNKAVIFDAPQGLEVEVLAEQDGFYQIRHAGAFTGWAHTTQIEILSPKFQQK